MKDFSELDEEPTNEVSKSIIDKWSSIDIINILYNPKEMN